MSRNVDTFTGSAIALLLAVIPLAVAIFALAACATPEAAVKRDAPERVTVPVATGCVAGERPARVAPLKERYDLFAWKALTAKQKAEIVAAQALRRHSYGEALAAATGGCR